MRGINFSFTIALHVDDLALLHFIKDKLGIGNIVVKKTRNVCVYTVTNREGLGFISYYLFLIGITLTLLNILIIWILEKLKLKLKLFFYIMKDILRNVLSIKIK